MSKSRFICSIHFLPLLLLGCPTDEPTPNLTSAATEDDSDGVEDDDGPGNTDSGNDSTGSMSAADTENTDTDTTNDTDSTGDSSGGDSSSGGDPPAGFACPPGSENLVLDLTGATLTPIDTTTVAPDQNSVQNTFLEGPVWSDGVLYVSQIDFDLQGGNTNPSRIWAYTPGTGFAPFLPDAGSNGIALDGDRLLTANHTVGGIVAFDIAAPALPGDIIVDEFNGNRFNSPNDLTLRSDGSIYFTDPSYQCNAIACGQGAQNQRAYWVNPSGVPTLIDQPQGNDIQAPNGIALSLDENTLYIGGSNGLFAYTIGGDGSPTGGAPFGQINGGVDGLGIDCAGNVYVTNGGTIQVRSSTGDDLGQLELDGGNATNVAFGGLNQTTLFITRIQDLGLFSVELNVPGYPY